MIKEARVEAAKWRRLRGWFADDVKAWTPRTAAYLLVGLDPEETERSADGRDWHFAWMPGSSGPKAKSDLYGLIESTVPVLREAERLTTAAPPEVRTPRQWVRWAEKIGLIPPWLPLAREAEDFRALLGLPPLPAPRKQSKAIPPEKVLAWLEQHQRKRLQDGKALTKQAHLVTACVEELRCDRNAARDGYKRLPPDLRLRQGAQPKAAK
jgi:hypothetical protein